MNEPGPDGIKVRLGQGARREELRCGFCRDDFLEQEQPRPCGACQTPYHSDCWEEELGGVCGIWGCAPRSPKRRRLRDQLREMRQRRARRRSRRALSAREGEAGTRSRLPVDVAAQARAKVLTAVIVAVVVLALLYFTVVLLATEPAVGALLVAGLLSPLYFIWRSKRQRRR